MCENPCGSFLDNEFKALSSLLLKPPGFFNRFKGCLWRRHASSFLIDLTSSSLNNVCLVGSAPYTKSNLTTSKCPFADAITKHSLSSAFGSA